MYYDDNSISKKREKSDHFLRQNIRENKNPEIGINVCIENNELYLIFNNNFY